jgi:hypothetical protein
VVSSQDPQRTHLQNGEKFIQGDRIIITYRRRRQELIDLAQKQP